jgi:hypothetical protein
LEGSALNRANVNEHARWVLVQERDNRKRRMKGEKDVKEQGVIEEQREGRSSD